MVSINKIKLRSQHTITTIQSYNCLKSQRHWVSRRGRCVKFMFHVTDKITLNYQRTERSCGVVVVVASTISTSLESSAALDMLLVLLVGMYATIFLFLLLMHNEFVVRGIGTETVEWSWLCCLVKIYTRIRLGIRYLCNHKFARVQFHFGVSFTRRQRPMGLNRCDTSIWHTRMYTNY